MLLDSLLRPFSVVLFEVAAIAKKCLLVSSQWRQVKYVKNVIESFVVVLQEAKEFPLHRKKEIGVKVNRCTRLESKGE